MKLATPQGVRAERSGLDVVLIIDGTGALTMPRAAAHTLARQLMAAVTEIDWERQKPFPNLLTKGH